jgi:hypothetical protein
MWSWAGLFVWGLGFRFGEFWGEAGVGGVFEFFAIRGRFLSVETGSGSSACSASRLAPWRCVIVVVFRILLLSGV